MITCPLCREFINDTSRAKGLHAQIHGMTSEEFFVILYCGGIHPKCECTPDCNEKTTWRGWKLGFLRQKRGHFSKKQIESRTETLIGTLSNNSYVHWTKRKENENIVKNAARKRSDSMKKGFSDGILKIWCEGKTKENDSILSKSAMKRSKSISRDLHWKWNDEIIIKEKMAPILGENFYVHDFEKHDINTKCSVVVVCKRCNFHKNTTVYNILRTNGTYRCHRCDHFQSKAEIEIGNFIKENCKDKEVLTGDKVLLKESNYELDIYIPEKKLAIEYNGLYWHSELQNEDKHYHQRKTDACKDMGVQLFHIFEDEWHEKKEIVKSMILHRLGVSKRKLNARKCQVREITKDERKDFFEKNHLDGDAHSVVAFGLFHGEELVSAISLRKLFKKNSDEKMEIARFSNSLNTSVVGSLGKLIKSCENWSKARNFNTIVTFVDMRLGNGRGYENVGFVKNGTTCERFWYTDGSKRLNRMVLKAKDNQSELERTISKRVARIYGCKNILLEKVLK